MADNMVKVVVDMVVKGRDQVRGAADDIDKLGPAGAGATRGIGALAGSLAAAGGVMVAAGFAAKKLWDVMGEGAQLQTTALRFDKLTASIGSTSDAMLGNLRTATKGMISDAELMASASGIISLRLAENEEQVVRLATVVGTLGWDMQQVILTFANLSTMRLDALGLSVDEVKNKQKELMEQGMSTAAAFKEAVIQAGEARLDVGGVGETEQQLKQIVTILENVKNEFIVAFTEGATGAIGTANDSLHSLESSLMALSPAIQEVGTQISESILQSALQLQGFSLFADLLAAGKVTREEWQALGDIIGGTTADMQAGVQTLTREHATLTLAQAHVTDGAALLETQLGRVGIEYGVLGNAEAALVMKTEAITVAVSKQSSALYDWSAAVANAVGQAQQMAYGRKALSGNDPGSMQYQYAARTGGWNGTTGAIQATTEAVRTYGGSLSTVMTQEDALAAAHARLADAFSAEAMAKPEDGLINAEGLVNVEAMNDALYQQAQSAGASAVQLAMLGVATGKFTKEQAAAALKAAVLQETIRKVAEGVASGNVKYDDAVGYLEEFRQKLDASGGGAEDATANVEDLVGMAKELTEGPYTADISANTVQARGDLEAILDLINGISGVHQATIVVTSDGDTGGDGSPTPGGGPGGETPELITSGYILSPARGGPHDWQSGGGLHVNITNYVDGREVARTKLDDVTEDRMRHALQSIGWN